MSDTRINSAPIDRWSAAHFGVGLLLGSLGLPWYWTLAGSIGFEIVENLAQPYAPSVFPETAPHDSPENSVLDTAFVMMGWTLGDLVVH